MTDELREQIISESLERLKRSSNLVIVGIPENTELEDKKIFGLVINSVVDSPTKIENRCTPSGKEDMIWKTTTS